MGRIGLILLACLALALQAVAQAPEKVAPDDLVVTAEIVGYGYYPALNKRTQSYSVWHVKTSILNKTQSGRKVTVMSCSWEDSWVSNGAYNFCGRGCDKNTPQSLVIPAGQSLVFYGDLCKSSKIKSENSEGESFKLGFLDVAEDDFWPLLMEGGVGMSKKPTVYWSNELNTSNYKNFRLSSDMK